MDTPLTTSHRIAVYMIYMMGIGDDGIILVIKKYIVREKVCVCVCITTTNGPLCNGCL
jgi:hypothetical protein